MPPSSRGRGAPAFFFFALHQTPARLPRARAFFRGRRNKKMVKMEKKFGREIVVVIVELDVAWELNVEGHVVVVEDVVELTVVWEPNALFEVVVVVVVELAVAWELNVESHEVVFEDVVEVAVVWEPNAIDGGAQKFVAVAMVGAFDISLAC